MAAPSAPAGSAILVPPFAKAHVPSFATSVNVTAFHVVPSVLHSSETEFVKVLVLRAPYRTVMLVYPTVEIPGFPVNVAVPVKEFPFVAVAFIDPEAPEYVDDAEVEVMIHVQVPVLEVDHPAGNVEAVVPKLVEYNGVCPQRILPRRTTNDAMENDRKILFMMNLSMIL